MKFQEIRRCQGRRATKWPLCALIAGALLQCASAWAMDKVAIPSLDGKLELPGYWFSVAGTQALPAVISLHGCGGMLNSNGTPSVGAARDASYFNAEKIHWLALDSFTPRGLKSICEIRERQRTVHEEDRRADVYAAVQWLARQPGVDFKRIAVLGRSHGAQTVLSVMDRSDKMVQAQPLRPSAAIALYPGCAKFNAMWNYGLAAPLSLMIGALDDWTPAATCEQLHSKVLRSQKDAQFDIKVYPGSYHGFDGVGEMRIMSGVNSRSGSAHVGGNPAAREDAHARIFEFLSAQWKMPLLMSHEERLKGHRYAVPQASGFAKTADVTAVPLSENGRKRYEYYLGLNRPKAFAITEKGGWYLASDDVEAMRTTMENCQRSKLKCWLYAVDDEVVWRADSAARVGLGNLQRRQH